MSKENSHDDFTEQLNALSASYEKQIFDLQQLLEISKSLNSTLDYNILMDSILLICMGQMHVLKIGVFTKKAIDHDFFSLHRNYKGFEIEQTTEYTVPEKSGLISFFEKKWKEKESIKKKDKVLCYTMPELLKLVDEVSDLKIFTLLEPTLIVPLIAKDKVNGIIIIGDRIDGVDFQKEEKVFLTNIALFAAIAVHNAFLFEMTTTDMMTKLKLRHFFYANLIAQQDKSLKEDMPLSVIMLDIDHFKKLNDTYGHTFGDHVLKRISAVVRENIRQIDIAARYGGEEFIILLPQADKNEAFIVAERVRKAVAAEKYMNGETEVKSTISLGVAQFDKLRDLSSENLIERADQALYVSKDSGRNQSTIAD